MHFRRDFANPRSNADSDNQTKRRRKVIFVHECYWHRHECQLGQVKAKIRASFWETKLSGNVTRDNRNLQEFLIAGWQVLVVWECKTRDLATLALRLKNFLNVARD